MDQGHSFTRCLQDVKIKDQESVLTRYQKYGPRPFIYKMSSRRQNKSPRQCWQGIKSMDQSHSFTRCLQDVKIKDQDSVLTRCQKGFSLINKSLPYTYVFSYFFIISPFLSNEVFLQYQLENHMFLSRQRQLVILVYWVL